ncbi:hypothetical protein [Gaetbulibacter aestuarii]|uniref:Uncharacterized protein n=1 Tax=Gaetbulibacter aestuarii TaxID=1502358 RepID=A0ABW7MUR3_9FLAO
MNFGFKLPINSVFKSENPILKDNNCLFTFKKNKIIEYRFKEKQKEYSIPIKNFIFKILYQVALVRRVLRLNVESMVVTNNKDLVVVARGAILFCRHGTTMFKEVHKIKRGSRPLNIYKHTNGNIYWGEYFDNKKREQVYIFGSKNGEKWRVKYIFPKKSIRHIHGIYGDQFRKGIWVLTGDLNDECGLWFTTDEFRTLKCVVGGTQKARAVSIIPLKEKLIVPMDTPTEKNYIQEYDFIKKKFNNLKELPGSAFHTYSSKNLYLVSTVVEPSVINNKKYLEIYSSVDCENWFSIGVLKQDFLSSLSYKFFRYPEVLFVNDESENSKEVFFYCRGIRKYNNRMLSISKKVIEDFIKVKMKSIEKFN